MPRHIPLCALLTCLGMSVSAIASAACYLDGGVHPTKPRIEAAMAEGGIVGAGAAVILDGQLVWRTGFGFADRESGRPFRFDTVMNIGSISKTITGAAMMRAVEQGHLSLDADIDTVLPFAVDNPHRPGAPITLRQLATHTSGLTDRWPVYAATYHFGRDAPQSLGDFLAGYLVPGGADYAPDNFLDVAPGTHRDYSNIGAGLAAYAVERATGQTLDVYTRAQFFEPLGMRNTRWHLADGASAQDATLYVSQDGIAMPIQPYALTTWPDGGLRTSVNDLGKFFAALLSGGEGNGARVLQRASVDEMLRLQFTADTAPDNMDVTEKNSGLFWQTMFNTRYVGHGGSDPGVKTEMLATRDHRLGVILFTNTSGEDTVKAHNEILQAVFAHAELMRDFDPTTCKTQLID